MLRKQEGGAELIFINTGIESVVATLEGRAGSRVEEEPVSSQLVEVIVGAKS